MHVTHTAIVNLHSIFIEYFSLSICQQEMFPHKVSKIIYIYIYIYIYRNKNQMDISSSIFSIMQSLLFRCLKIPLKPLNKIKF